jgi:hypothetical protein
VSGTTVASLGGCSGSSSTLASREAELCTTTALHAPSTNIAIIMGADSMA